MHIISSQWLVLTVPPWSTALIILITIWLVTLLTSSTPQTLILWIEYVLMYLLYIYSIFLVIIEMIIKVYNCSNPKDFIKNFNQGEISGNLILNGAQYIYFVQTYKSCLKVTNLVSITVSYAVCDETTYTFFFFHYLWKYLTGVLME